MDKRPEWVPAWIWAEFVDFRRWRTADTVGDDMLPRMYRRMDSIMAASECVSLWRAVENRKDALDARRTLMGLGAGFRVCAMLYGIAANAEGVPPEEALSVAVRKRRGHAVARYARALREALADVELTGTPAAFEGPLNDYAQQYPESYVPHESINATFVGATMTPELAAACIAGFRDAVDDLVLVRFAAVLDTFERAGMALAGSAPPVVQLASPEAARLHFVRETTKTMRFHFGQPLREPVAALTRVLFECDMDAATVAKLAP